jgi:hypothetical protein
MSESEYSFDKFVEDIVRREDERHKLEETPEKYIPTPNRRYNELYRERWQNRVRYHKPGKK